MERKEMKTVKRKQKQKKPIKIAALVVSAIQDLCETKGSTSKRIEGYISYASSVPEKRIKQQVKAALKRGVEHGILRRDRGHYFLPTGDELDRANRIASRFARLPTPAKSKINRALKIKNRKGSRGIGNIARKSKKVESTPSVSASSSLTDKIADDAVSVME
ncbi:uncharacterized protein LOC114941007 [Nylanderia fulva]|uniref:uncharacterized protein LOC114941007 n=1 Tax=Nylanderia fulva TaxID=613905 RepID=UPI0010FB45F8|nr:uncharacterized protein LOC114941007 [Nylanderia fulva]